MKKILAVAVACATASSLVQADNYSARSTAMGGTGVASSGYDAAGGYNPALLANFGDDDLFSLTLPHVTVEVSDKDEVLDQLDDMEQRFDDLKSAINSLDVVESNRLKDRLIDDLESISRKPVRADVSAAISLAIPNETLSVGVDLRGYSDIGVEAVYVETDEAILNDAIATANQDRVEDIESYAVARGALVSELAVSLARKFDVKGKTLLVGVTPKLQSVETILYAQNVNNYDEDDFDADDYTTDDNSLNLDLGVAYQYNERVTVGLTLKDLIAEDYETVRSNIGNFSDTYEITPYATLGGAYSLDWFEITAEADLNERGGFASTGGSQFARLGVEFDALGWAQLRAGYRSDLNNVTEDVITAGIGLSPFEVFHLDLTGMVGDNDTYGASLELKLTL